MEHNFILQFLMNDVNDVQATIFGHKNEIFLRIKSQQAPFVFVPLADSLNYSAFQELWTENGEIRSTS